MEMLFQINTRYNYLVGDTNNTQDEYHYTINEQKNQLLLSNNTFSFNHVINESNSILLNNLVNKQIKERDEFNVLYLGKDININYVKGEVNETNFGNYSGGGTSYRLVRYIGMRAVKNRVALRRGTKHSAGA